VNAAGYAVLDGFLTATEVEAVRATVPGIVEKRTGTTCARPNNTLLPLRWNDPAVDIVLADTVRTARLAAAVNGTDLRWISGYLSTKDPDSGPLWWHQDWWCWSHPVTYRLEPVQVAVVCPLQDTDRHHGALRLLPGSHAASVPLHRDLPVAHRDRAGATRTCGVAMRHQPGEITLELAAGDAVVLDYRLLHGTHPNTGERRRDGLLLSFAPSWRGLPDDIRAHLIRHPALPGDDAQSDVSSWARSGTRSWAPLLLPDYDGPRRDLPLVRDAPAEFVIGVSPTIESPGPRGRGRGTC
jgi:hypothetical protein